MPWRVLPLLAFGVLCARNWAIAGSDVFRAELADQQLAGIHGTVAQYDCLGNAMFAQLPATRAKLLIDVPPSGEQQRLTEIGYPRHDIVADIADADYVVKLGAEASDCGAPKVIVSPAR